MQDYVEQDSPNTLVILRRHPPCWLHTIVAIISGPDPTNRAIQMSLFGWIVSEII